MNLRFLKNYQKGNTRLVGENLILETEFSKNKEELFPEVRYFIYDVNHNTRRELLPNIHKVAPFRFIDATFYSEYIKYIYMFQYLAADEIFQMIRYGIDDGSIQIIYNYSCNIESLADKNISFFILNDSNFLIQKEEKNEEDVLQNCRYFKYSSFLYNINEEKSYEVIDENLISNGIETIIPLNENNMIIKTGYNLLINQRYETLTKEEVAVEAISIVNTSQFISDIMIMQNGIIMNALEQSYFTQTLPRIMVQGEFLIFSKLDLETKSEMTFFYNHVTKETCSCLSKNVTTIEKMSKPLLVGEIPYVRINHANRTDFLNLQSKKIDISFGEEQHLDKVVNDLFLVTEERKKILGKHKYCICFYKYPSLSLLHTEHANYTGCLYDDKTDTLYVYCE